MEDAIMLVRTRMGKRRRPGNFEFGGCLRGGTGTACGEVAAICFLLTIVVAAWGLNMEDSWRVFKVSLMLGLGRW